MPYAKIAEILGVSPMRVRQIEQRALQKLREAFRRRGITSPFSDSESSH
ncbi:MAG TPA: sigma factor-like helix-turn-helix DNA-binding protein [Verrucomicrobiae bacterium]|nr:sigma factor-like helix-turn-helix DNA-binding protein [Verrucomicrobiae bacterium]